MGVLHEAADVQRRDCTSMGTQPSSGASAMLIGDSPGRTPSLGRGISCPTAWQQGDIVAIRLPMWFYATMDDDKDKREAERNIDREDDEFDALLTKVRKGLRRRKVEPDDDEPDVRKKG